MRDLTQLLNEAANGDGCAEAELLELVYADLKRIARLQMGRERNNHTLQATALIHEAYLRLADREKTWLNRTQFYAVAAQVMRRILVDHARSARAHKRGSGAQKLSVDDVLLVSHGNCEELLDVDNALSRLNEWDPRQAKIVELRFFGGLTEEEVASVMHVSVRTVKRDWKMAKAWLRSELIKSGRSD